MFRRLIGRLTAWFSQRAWRDPFGDPPAALADVLAWFVDDEGLDTVDQVYRRSDGNWYLSGYDSDLRVIPHGWQPLPAPPGGHDDNDDEWEF